MTGQMALLIVIGLSLFFDVTNGFHDSANAIAALISTRAARPLTALAIASTGHVLGPLLAGTAVADTVGGVVTLPGNRTLAAIGAAMTAAILWNLMTWWRGLPSSSSHALIGGLVGAAIAADGWAGVRWGGAHGGLPRGVLGVLLGLGISPVLGAAVGWAVTKVAARATRRARRELDRDLRRAEWGTAFALAYSHGANDAQKTMGVITLLLVSTDHLHAFAVPLWVKLASATALVVGTAMGGWRIVRTLGRGIYRMRPLDGLVSQSSSTAVIYTAAALGAPVSTTHVVASAVVGSGAAQRSHHVRWPIVGEMASAWIVTLPASALAGAALLPLWEVLL
ncbi:MAG TPA: inorganic phosphate transporter [Marmoricola sp.]|nr:inorganic phosphate transporter [Marmoricola sp.]